MNALLLTAPSKLDYTEVETPTGGTDDVLVRVRACGICGSDIHGWDGSSGRRHPPLIMGHEAAGEIAQLGANVTGWSVGQRVTFDSTIYCGKCPACERGDVNLCDDRRVLGVSPDTYKQHGAFAEYVAVPARILYALPDGLSYEEAAFAEPVSIALHGVKRANIQPGDTAVVIGSGMIGLLVIQALRVAGIERVIAVDREASRLATALELGATDTVMVEDDTTSAKILALTHGRGADVVMEVVGIEPTVKLAIACTRPGARIGLIGNLAPNINLPLQQVVTRELSLLGSCSCAGEYPQSLELITSGQIKVKPLMAATAPLSDGAEWFAKLSAPDGGKYLKVILNP
jgi:L-iditol 2-dehydrogenase